jgi:hypothetical protein
VVASKIELPRAPGEGVITYSADTNAVDIPFPPTKCALLACMQRLLVPHVALVGRSGGAPDYRR